jgi:hypothetical protein
MIVLDQASRNAAWVVGPNAIAQQDTHSNTQDPQTLLAYLDHTLSQATTFGA